MIPTKWFTCFFVFCILKSSFAFTLADRDSLRLRILEFDIESGGKLVQVLTSRNADIIYGEDVSQGIVLECRSSSGPVTIQYTGDGNPQYIINTNTTRTSNSLYFWTFMSFTRVPKAEDTGNYTCQEVNDPTHQNSVYLYVPDSSQSVFVPSRLANRLEYPKGNYFRIPCGVVHPGAKVSLERVSSDNAQLNTESQITYNPKSGFYIPISMVNSRGSTTYLCKASFRGKNDETEFKIYSELPSESEFLNRNRNPTGLRSACTSSTCGRQAECVVIDYAAHCVCLENYSGDPWTTCYKMDEQSQQYSIKEDPCLKNRCGRDNPCIVVNGHAVCTCQGNHQGAPTICKPQKYAPFLFSTTPKPYSHCKRNEDCSWDQYCKQRFGVCENICSNNSTSSSCGQNTKCRPSNHALICECLKGYGGNPYRSKSNFGCELLENNKKSICHPDTCGINAHCIGPSTCVCPEGFTGDPKILCQKMGELLIPIVEDRESQLCNRVSCGSGANCRVQKNKVQCFCPSGSTGNPLEKCDLVVPQEDFNAIKACNACGPNSVCTVTERKIFCECAPNATGNSPHCVHKNQRGCRDNLDCSDDKICDRGKCVNPCWMCSDNANCSVINHKIKCTCPPGYEGNALFKCVKVSEPEEILENHPCKINCGPNTVCRVVTLEDLQEYRNKLRQARKETIYFDMMKANGNLQGGMFSECLCRKNYFGNPYAVAGCGPLGGDQVTEYPATIVVMEPKNPCEPISPCGKNSFCRAHNGRAFCSCDFDSFGQPPNCKTRCSTNSHCMFSESCIRGVCQEK